MDAAALAQQTETRNLGDDDAGENNPRWGTARFDDHTRLILRISESGQIIKVDAHRSAGILLGRYDPTSKFSPDIDLTGFHAEQHGVSRQHARLTINEESLYITDLGSANHTFLNGLRLTAHQPRILRDGDEIRLGHLKLQITFIDAVDETP